MMKIIGRIVTQAYLPRPSRNNHVVTTHRAIAASSWLAMPNMGQMVWMEPVQISEPQPMVTSAVQSQTPGHQSIFWNFGEKLPRTSWSRNRAMRVPVSIVVRMKSASNMMAK